MDSLIDTDCEEWYVRSKYFRTDGLSTMVQTRVNGVRLLRLILGVCIGESLFGAMPTYKVTPIQLLAGFLDGFALGITDSGSTAALFDYGTVTFDALADCNGDGRSDLAILSLLRTAQRGGVRQ